MSRVELFRPLRLAGGLLLAASALFSQGSHAAVTIVINNINAPGVGFNDPTPAVPVGGNPGTTLGAQRLFAFTYAANLWGASLTSSTPISINAQFTPLSCSATGAVLGSAGATEVFSDFPSSPKANTWYSYALANKISGTDLDAGAPQINARFNSNLGQAGCLTGTFFYLGVDGLHGNNVDFVEVLLHEMGHGLGFQTFTNGQTGAQFIGVPSVWDHFLASGTTGTVWKDMTDSERAASALSVDKLVWSGPLVNAAGPTVLRVGNPGVFVAGSTAGATAGLHAAGEASFGASLSTPVAGKVMPITPAGSTSIDTACNPFTPAQALAARGNVALVSRGTCTFVVKVKNAQNAGAIGVLVADNAAGSPPPALGGSDPTITIPAVRVTQADGIALLAATATRSRTSSGVLATLGLFGSNVAGMDAFRRMMMYAPNPYEPGSSVSHFSTAAFPNLLMEPAINGDLTQSLIPPKDLTLILLKEIGW